MTAKEEEKEMSFLDHLEELRWHIIRSAISIIVFAVIAFIAKEFLFHTLILGPSRTDFWTYRKLCELADLTGTSDLCVKKLPFILQNLQLAGQFTLHFKVALTVGLICAFPYTFWEIWRFVSPGLYPNERNVTRGAVFFVSVLFILGVLFGYYILSPLTIQFLANYQVDPSIRNFYDFNSYVSTISTLVLVCGLIFQLPIVVYFFSLAGIITPNLMKRFRRHAYIVILIIAAFITPSPDMISQIIVSIPLVFLYEMSIFVSSFVLKKKKKKELINYEQ